MLRMPTCKFLPLAALLLLAALAGCTDSRSPLGPPHPLGQRWVVAQHGPAFLEGTGRCSECHQIDEYCVRCHFDPRQNVFVPPGVDWEHGTVPHAFLAPYGETCNSCHSILRRAGDGPAPCHDCHEGSEVPHPLDQSWIVGGHGEAYEAGTLDCSQCHDIGTFCVQCHFDPRQNVQVPAGVEWTHGTVPHDSLAPYEDTCNTCHNILRDAGDGPGSCHDCHGEGLPHPTGQAWLDSASPTFHGTQAQADLSYCRGCHGEDLTGGVSGVSCSTCHFGPSGSRVPPGVQWQHGSLNHGDLDSFVAVCETCHGYTRSFRNEPSACDHCH